MKFYYGDDVRVLEVPSTLAYDDLKRAVYKKYSQSQGDSFKIAYKVQPTIFSVCTKDLFRTVKVTL